MSKWKKFTSACLVAALSTALLAGCGGEKKDSAAANADKYVIGASFELTGNVANYGKSTLSGLKLAVDQVNKAGGVNGKQLVVVESDNKSEPAESGNSVTKLITQDKVVAVVGPATSGCVFAATPVVTSNKVPLIAPCATAPAITVDNGQVKEFIFRACFIDPFQGRVMAEFADKTLGVKNVAILHDASSDYSKGLAEVFEKTLNEKGGKVVAKEAFLSKDIDFKAALTKIKAANPEAIYIPGYYEEVAKIIKQTREIGLNVPLIGPSPYRTRPNPFRNLLPIIKQCIRKTRISSACRVTMQALFLPMPLNVQATVPTEPNLQQLLQQPKTFRLQAAS